MFYLLERSIPDFDIVIWEDDPNDNRNVFPRLVVQGYESHYKSVPYNKRMNFDNVFHKITEFKTYEDALAFLALRAL